MRIEFSKQAVKAIQKMDRQLKQRMKNGIEGLPEGDIKPLKGSAGSFRLRIGNWRIIFSYLDKDVILIEKIAPRGEIYKGV